MSEMDDFFAPVERVDDVFEALEAPVRIRKKVDKLTRAKMRAFMAALFSDENAYTHEEIARQTNEEFGLVEHELTAQNVGYHIKTQIDFWKKLSAQKIDDKMAITLTRLDQLERMCQDAYFMSCKGKTTKHQAREVKRYKSKEYEEKVRKIIKDEINLAELQNRKVMFAEGDLPELLETMEEQLKQYKRVESASAGDPRWVGMMFDINKERAKLWNLYARVDDGDKDAAMKRLTDKERSQKVMSIIGAAIGRASKQSAAGTLAAHSPLEGKPIQEIENGS